MTGKTHKAGGALCALLGVQLLKNNNMLLDGINPLVQFLVIYPFSIWGSTAPDLDQDNMAMEDRNPVDLAICKALHVFNPIYNTVSTVVNGTPIKCSKAKLNFLKLFSCKHRSWQTHSDLTLVIMILLLRFIMKIGTMSIGISKNDIQIISLCVIGVIIGFISHLLLDMLTRDGIKLVSVTIIRNVACRVFRLKKSIGIIKFSIVPNSEIFSVSNESYEKSVRKVISVTTVVYGILIVISLINKGIVLDSINYMSNKITSIF